MARRGKGNDKRGPVVKGAAKRPPRGEIGAVKRDYDLFSILSPDTKNPDVARSEFGARYLQDIAVKDAQYRNCLAIRKAALLRREWQIVPASDDARDVEVAEFVDYCLRHMRGTFKQDLRELLDAVPMGYSIMEIVYNDDPFERGPFAGKYGLKALKHKSPELFGFKTDDYGNIKDDGFLIKGSDGISTEGKPLPREKFIHFIYDSLYENPYGRGLASTAVWYAWFKKNCLKFWLIFLEKFGSPTLMIKLPEGQDKDDEVLDRVYAILKSVQQETGFWFPEGFEVKLLEALRAGEGGYERLSEYCDAQITKAIIGQTLTTDSGSKGSGSYALGKVHLSVKDDIVQGDAEEVEDCVTEQLIRRLVDYNYVVDEYPRLVLVAETAAAELGPMIFRVLLEAGLPVGVNWVYKHYGISKPGEDEQLLKLAEGPALPFSEKQVIERFAESSFDAATVAFTEQVGHNLDSILAAMLKKGNSVVRVATDEWLERVKESGIIKDQDLGKLPGLSFNFKALQEPLYQLLYAGSLMGITDAQLRLKQKGWRPGEKKSAFSEFIGRVPVMKEILRFASPDPPDDDVPGRAAGFPEEAGLPTPEEGARYLMGIQSMPRDVFDKTGVYRRAFTIAYTMERSAIDAAEDWIYEAVNNGWTFEEFRDALLADPKFKNAYHPPAGVNENAHLETVYRNNLMSVYTRGRLEMFNDPELDGFVVAYRYNAILDSRTRPAHAAMDGRIYPKDHPVWKQWMPPNGHNCRCTIEPVVETEAWKESELPPEVTVDTAGKTVAVKPDKGFGRSAQVRIPAATTSQQAVMSPMYASQEE